MTVEYSNADMWGDKKKTVQYSEYNGHPIIEILVNSYKGKDEYLKLGLKKCKILLGHLKEIEDFVNQYEGKNA